MSINNSNGLQITPLVMAVCGALWLVIVGLGSWILVVQYDGNEKLTTLITSQRYDRNEIDAIKGDVKDVRGEVRELSDRVGKLEPRK